MINHVLTIDQMRELQELGIDTSKASMYWYGTDEVEFVCFGTDMDKDCGDEICPTFTLQDILEMLPEIDGDVPAIFGKDFFGCGYFHDSEWEESMERVQYGDTPLEAAFNMLKYLKKNNYI